MLIVTTRRRYSGIDHGDDRNAPVLCDTKKQPQVAAVHISRYADSELVPRLCHLLPALFELPAYQVGCAQMTKAIVNQRISREARPVMIVNLAWHQPRFGECRKAGGQLLVFE